MSHPAPDIDVVDLLIQDHRSVEALFAQIQALSGSTDDTENSRRQDLTEQVIIELVKHSVAEEAAVYPRIAERVDEEEAKRLIREQAEAEETMKRLERLHPGDPDFDTEFTTLTTEISAHVAEEESVAFPKLRATFSAGELMEMAAKVEHVKAVAPTRPHPSAPDTPPGNVLLGPMTGLFDRMRDAVTGRGV